MADFFLLETADAENGPAPAVFYSADRTPAEDIRANRDAVRGRVEAFVQARRDDRTLAPDAPFLVLVDFVLHPTAVAVFKAEAVSEDETLARLARVYDSAGREGVATLAAFSGEPPFPPKE